MFFNASNPQARKELKDLLGRENRMLVVCYCAEWCRSCESYHGDFEALSSKYDQLIFLWVDIEDQPDLLNDRDPDNFPTILIQNDDKNLFFGAMLPHIGHLERMIETAMQGGIRQGVDGPAAIETLLE